MMEFLAEGTQATVFRAINGDGREIVMKLPHFEPEDGGIPVFLMREYIALTRLQHDNHFPRVVGFDQILDEDGHGRYCLCMEYFGTTTLSGFIRTFVNSNTLIDRLTIKKIMFQICKALSVCHSLDIMHRDLNGENILINERSHTVKIVDFGSSRLTSANAGNVGYSPGVGHLNFMAPEILMGSVTYSYAADVWSLGIIFALLAQTTNQPLFNGASAVEVLLQIFSWRGTPTEADLPGITEVLQNIDEENAQDIAEFTPLDLSQWFPRLDIQGLDLLSRMLTTTPQMRISPHEALNHPFFNQIELQDRNFL